MEIQITQPHHNSDSPCELGAWTPPTQRAWTCWKAPPLADEVTPPLPSFRRVPGGYLQTHVEVLHGKNIKISLTS